VLELAASGRRRVGSSAFRRPDPAEAGTRKRTFLEDLEGLDPLPARPPPASPSLFCHFSVD